MNFEGKAVLITGSTRGIGKVTAGGFLARGAQLALLLVRKLLGLAMLV